MYTKKFLFALSLSVLSIAFAASLFIQGRVRHPVAKIHADGLAAPAEVGPLDDRSPEVKASLPLFYRVNESYTRGAEPTSGGVRALQRLGIKTLLDLRSVYDRTDAVKAAAERLSLTYHWLPMSVWYAPSDDEAKKFLSLVADRSKGPFYVFCSDGMHRTGEMSAIYRIDQEEWSLERALKEMDEVGFNPYYYTLRNYVWTYARKFKPSSLPRSARRVVPTDEWDQRRSGRP